MWYTTPTILPLQPIFPGGHMDKKAPLSRYGQDKEIEEAQMKFAESVLRFLAVIVAAIFAAGAAWAFKNGAYAPGMAYGLLMIIALYFGAMLRIVPQ